MGKKIVLFVGFITLVYLITTQVYHYKKDVAMEDAAKYRFSDITAALEFGISAENNLQTNVQTAGKLSDCIVMETTHKGNPYYVIKIPYTESNLKKDDIYIARITEKNNQYQFERMTAFYSLNTPGDIPDVEYTPYAGFGIEVDDLHFSVGKIYDKGYKPYGEDEFVYWDESGIYAAVSDQTAPKIDVKQGII